MSIITGIIFLLVLYHVQKLQMLIGSVRKILKAHYSNILQLTYTRGSFCPSYLRSPSLVYGGLSLHSDIKHLIKYTARSYASQCRYHF